MNRWEFVARVANTVRGQALDVLDAWTFGLTDPDRRGMTLVPERGSNVRPGDYVLGRRERNISKGRPVYVCRVAPIPNDDPIVRLWEAGKARAEKRKGTVDVIVDEARRACLYAWSDKLGLKTYKTPTRSVEEMLVAVREANIADAAAEAEARARQEAELARRKAEADAETYRILAEARAERQG